MPIVAPQSPGDCFDAAVEAVRIAVTYRTPVMLLSDGYLANGSEPWRIPELDELPAIDPAFATGTNHESLDKEGNDQARLLALPARRGDPRPSVGDPRHPRSRAPHRRAGEGRRPREHLLRPGQPRLHGPHPPGQGGPDRRLAAAARGRRPVRAGQGPHAGLGLDVRPDRRGLPPRPQGRVRRRPGAPAPPQPVPQGPRRDPQGLRRGDGPRDEPRPALAADPREVPRRRGRLQPRPRTAAQGGRARRGHHRPDQHHYGRGECRRRRRPSSKEAVT